MTALQTRWQQADHVYLIDNLGDSGYTMLTIEAARPFIYQFGRLTDIEIEALASVVDYTAIPDFCNSPSEWQPVFSPDGRYYMTRSKGANAHVLIFTADGELVAEAAKAG